VGTQNIRHIIVYYLYVEHEKHLPSLEVAQLQDEKQFRAQGTVLLHRLLLGRTEYKVRCSFLFNQLRRS
jgi:hypothetical protein